MSIDVLRTLEKMAQNGQPPQDDCRLFSVGYDDAFERLKKTYLQQQFKRGDSAEKFVIGPFGSGKTHFLRRLIELARDAGCATAEVPLTKELDYTHTLVVYGQVVGAMVMPNQPGHGVGALLRGALERVRQTALDAGSDPGGADDVVRAWVSGLEGADFEWVPFIRVTRRALEGILRNDDPAVAAAERWIGGDMRDRDSCRLVSETPLVSAEEKLAGRGAMLSLFQFIRHAGYTGTVVGYDEAEQGLSVDAKRLQRIHSLLQSEINALSKLDRGSVLILYALTPEVVEKMNDFMALQQRVSDPGPNQGFFDGNVFAPKIDLTQREDPANELLRIAERLHSLFFEHVEDAPIDQKPGALVEVRRLAEDTARSEPSASARREVVRRVSTYLARVANDGFVPEPPDIEPEV